MNFATVFNENENGVAKNGVAKNGVAKNGVASSI